LQTVRAITPVVETRSQVLSLWARSWR
jgi:hypothetical protein